MKLIHLILLTTGLLLNTYLFAQQEQVISPSNGSVASLEKNILFYADRRYNVSQSGSAQLPIHLLFDGNMDAVYTTQGINPSNPFVLLIENLPDRHTQRGAWIGWSARYYAPKKFKLEVFDQWNNIWVTVADVTNNPNGYFIVQVPSMSVGKIRFTVYGTSQGENIMGLSEFFFIHPEATTAYDNLLVNYSPNGNVGIGTINPQDRLSVKGKIRAEEIRVTTAAADWPDYVFDPNYQMPSLQALETFIKTNKHLPDIPTAKEVETDGISVGDMINKLLKKNEELTLHAIENEKKRIALEDKVSQLEKLILTLSAQQK
ncbi:hypothetical protein K7A41_07670 [Sphingobacterium sp. InxBP1]|uniref:tail fiber protein n=1 Tax=Sphingobacterium sp. InxBP1 TaxID=2870328 RepID=UPI0022446E57|nr:tail fiber protein [Sphingobacterium sp. InxBP1]MCW8311096.1 hypothetical protein [Sphingobacterium sp. InxBP1]